jgi:hypothetical protein
MFDNLTPQEKHTVKTVGVIGIAALGVWGIYKLMNKDDDSGNNLPDASGASSASGQTTTPVAPTVPNSEIWNVNTPLCYKSPYTRMVKVLQSGINEIAKSVKEPTIKVDGKFGPGTLKKVHSYFNAECVNLYRLTARLNTIRAAKAGNADNGNTGGSGGSW